MKKFISFLSPAKLNLGLKIVGKRNDGFHLLKTIFCLIDLFDEINIQVTNNGKISLIEHNQAWNFWNDLSYKAAITLKKFTNCNLGCNIKIKKTIPSGAGLGGGSSNAATILIALNQLWQTHLPIETLHSLGKTLGADVPFFIHGRNALASGIGDEFEDINLTEQYFILIKPNFHISTHLLFNNLQLEPKTSTAKIDYNYLLQSKENDLLATACKLQPKLLNILNDLKNYGTPTMTGSGSVLYLSYPDLSTAKNIAKELYSRYNPYLVKSMDFSPMYIRS